MSTALTVQPLLEVSNDPGRRLISETVHHLSNGSCRRITLIETLSDAPEALRLGDHSHPDHELFIVRTGTAVLYVAPVNDLTDVTVYHLTAGDTIDIPADVAHTFLCQPGTVLESHADHEYYDGWIIPNRLEFI